MTSQCVLHDGLTLTVSVTQARHLLDAVDQVAQLESDRWRACARSDEPRALIALQSARDLGNLIAEQIAAQVAPAAQVAS